MNNEAKEEIQNKLRDALDIEKISQREAAQRLGINQGYLSMMKTGSNLRAIPDKVWLKIGEWAYSNFPITNFENGLLIHKSNKTAPEVAPIIDEIRQKEAISRGVDIIIERMAGDLKQEEKEAFMPFPILDSKETAYKKFQEQRMSDLRIALLYSLENCSQISIEWAKEYNELCIMSKASES